jgi:hypothetical protein
MHFLKRNLAYLAEDYQITNYDDFSAYAFANFSTEVWVVVDGIEYCYAEVADKLAKEYLEYKSMVAEFKE